MGHRVKLIQKAPIDNLSAISQEAARVRTQYTYLNDDLELSGWMWEFIRRNPNYKMLYNDIKQDIEKMTNAKGDATLKSFVIKIKKGSVFQKILRLKREFNISIFFPSNLDRSEVNNFMKIRGLNFTIGMPNPDVSYDKFTFHYPEIGGVKAIRFNQLDHNIANKNYRHLATQNRFKTYCSDVLLSLAPTTLKNTLYVGISLGANKDEVKRQLSAMVDKYFTEKAKKRKNLLEWRYYIIAYDLSQAGNNHNEIGDIMAEAFVNDGDNDERLFNMWNVKNYCRKGRDLIFDEFREYFYPIKKVAVSDSAKALEAFLDSTALSRTR